ncbi:MAG: transglutaminase-like domain-containing protein [Bacteroidota bacterium]|nr:transglutaminase-like domain-containing protein [Bacteroidota bacterium]MDP4231848.1 transglutaminase-like domain-containing protein [Bacteroidota bacterium]MDP4242734.1 transglutaminase-like domain-containing protein [Bacteroidota bacterium]MDP4287185.1 transglutaminase-like domain-containing protein [Bacteroidota bacterium]
MNEVIHHIEQSILPPVEPDSELRSLLSLLDDPDPRIADAVTQRIRMRGEDALLPLMTFLESASDPLARKRAEELSAQFNLEQLRAGFENLALRFKRSGLNARADAQAFEDGLFLIARYGNPRLNVAQCRQMLDEFASSLDARLVGLSSALEVLDEINYFFFEELHFRGNQASFLEPENSYVDAVLERRMGIPISLASVYLLVVQCRLHLPFSGASAPGHFLVRYDGLRTEPLFIDAFNGGTILRARDIKRFLDSSGLPFHNQFLAPSHPRGIVLRTIRNLILVFNERGNIPARKAFEEFMRILAPDAAEGQAFLRGLEG